MAIWLKQSTSVDLPIGPFVDSTDGNTPETALTLTQPDIRLKKNGGAWAQKAAAQTLSHEENGWYEVTLDATDTDTLGALKLAVHESGALPVWMDFQVVPANVWDSLFGADKLQVHAVEIDNGLITAAAIATNAIDADALAADAVTEIQSGLATAAALAAVDDFIDTEIADIQARLPAALVSGRIDASVGAMAANTVTATAIAANAITAAKIATDAIDADALAADAVTEIQSGLSTSAEIAAVQADTDNIQTRLPAALVSGRMDSSVGAMAANVITAAAVATDAIDNDAISANAVTEIQSGLATAAAVSGLNNLSAAQVNAEVLDVLNVDTFAEITSIPAAVTTLAAMLRTLYAFCTNEVDETATLQTLRNRADSASIGTATVSDDNITAVRGSFS